MSVQLEQILPSFLRKVETRAVANVVQIKKKIMVNTNFDIWCNW